jgi:hypothetical protein
VGRPQHQQHFLGQDLSNVVFEVRSVVVESKGAVQKGLQLGCLAAGPPGKLSSLLEGELLRVEASYVLLRLEFTGL